MNVVFAVEKFSAMMEDAKAIFPIHYEELALDKSQISLDLDFERYLQGEAAGAVHVVTVRFAGQLVGYHIGLLLHHLHYKSAGLMMYTDIYYLLPNFRKGGCGAKLFAYLEKELKAIGVVKIYTSTKVHSDNTKLLEAMGFKVSDKVLTKYIGNK